MPALRRLRLENHEFILCSPGWPWTNNVPPQPPKCWDYRSGPLYTAQIQFLNLLFSSVCICCMHVYLRLWGQSFILGCLSFTPILHTFFPLWDKGSVKGQLAHLPVSTPSVFGHSHRCQLLLGCWGLEFRSSWLNNKHFMRGAISLAPVSSFQH